MEEIERKRSRMRQTRQVVKKETKLTSIGELFKVELTIIRLCAGFMFEPKTSHLFLSKLLSSIYRICLIVATRWLAAKYYQIRPQTSEGISKASWQNIELFWTANNITSVVTLAGTVLTGWRYQSILLIILKKRFDKRYLEKEGAGQEEPANYCYPTTNGQANRATVNPTNICSNSSLEENQTTTTTTNSSPASASSTSTCSRKPLISGRGQQPLCHQTAKLPLNALILNTATKGVLSEFKQFDSSSLDIKHQVSRVRLFRLLALFNLLLTTAAKFVSAELSRFMKARKMKQLQVAFNVSSTMSMSTPLPPQFNATTTNQTLFILPTATTPPPPESTANNDNNNNNNSQFQGHFQAVVAYDQLIELLMYISTHALELATRLLAQFFNSALNINQFYGHALVTLMITATIADMLHKSVQLDHHTATRVSPTGRRAVEANQMVRNVDGRPHRHRPSPTEPPRRPLVTTELLIQIRDTLVALRKAMSLDYLLLMLYDMSRLMNAFCMFSSLIATDRILMAALIFVEYLRIALSIFLTRIGYHWLHMEVRKLRLINERKILETAANVNDLQSVSSSAAYPTSASASSSSASSSLSLSSPFASSASSSAHSNAAKTATIQEAKQETAAVARPQTFQHTSKAEVTTTFRLTREIEALWPTDWFTPDFKSYLTQNFFVVTFVATLQQLVEASNKVEYQATQMGAG